MPMFASNSGRSSKLNFVFLLLGVCMVSATITVYSYKTTSLQSHKARKTKQYAVIKENSYGVCME
jgi:flagellar basal body-associated protein FliL